MKIYLGGHLNYYNRDGDSWLSINIKEPISLTDILQDYKIPIGEIQLVVINGKLQDLETVVSDKDLVRLFSAVGGG